MSVILFVCSVFANVFEVTEKTLIVLSHWVVLLSFYEADWWHFTDPSSTGISTKAIIILLMALFLPTVLILCKRFVMVRIGLVKRTIFKVTPAFLLFLSSLPFLAQLSWVRTGLLALGVALSPLLLTIALSQHFGNFHDDKERKCGCTQSCFKPIICQKVSNSLTSETEHLNFGVSKHESGLFDNHSEAIILVAVLINMTIRLYFGTINVFYEAWPASLSLLICLSSFAFFSCFQTRKKLFHSKERKSIASVSTHTEIVLTTDKEDKAWGCQIENNDDESSHRQIRYLDRQESLVKLAITDDGDSLSTESNLQTTFDKTFSHTTNSSKHVRVPLLFTAGGVLGFSLGTQIVMFLWLFSTPNLLPRWSGENPKSHAFLVLLFFGIGTLLSLCHKGILSVTSQRSRMALLRNSKRTQISIWDVTSILILVAYIVLLVGACMLQMQESSSHPTFVGSLMFCAILPCCFSLNLLALRYLFGYFFKTAASNILISCFHGIVYFLVAIAFLISHIILVLFVNPQLTTMFLGRMDIILAYQVLVVIASLSTSTIVVRVSHMLKRERKQDYKEDILDDSASSEAPTQQNPFSVAKALILGILTVFILIMGLCSGPLYIPKHCLQQHSVADNRVMNTYGNLNHSNGTFTVLSWNILLGHDKYGRDNLPCVGRILDIMRPDVIGLEESEALSPYWGSKDILGYLSGYLGNTIKTYLGVHPLKSSLGVAILTSRTVTKHESYLLPADDTDKLPHYSLVRIDCQMNNRSVTVFNVHAVFKNWTATTRNPCPFANVSAKQINFVAQEIETLDPAQPVILMGDFNLNPNEPQLDILHKLGFQNALHRHRDLRPPSTIRNRFAIIDHIFYRNLNLTESKIIVETEDISDHNPVIASFRLPT